MAGVTEPTYEHAAALRAKWARDLPVVGPFLQLPAPGVVEIFAHAGFDLVNIDLEHGTINFETAENMVRAANVHGIAPMVRVLANRPELITAALNIGAAGVLVPHVSTMDEAAAAVAAAKFGPVGTRGVCPFVRAAGYSAHKETGFYELANTSVVTCVMLEGSAGLDALDDILTLAELDIVFVGPYDLSQSLGVTGQIMHPLVVGAVEGACVKAARHAKAVGLFVEEAERAAEWVRRGVRYVGLDIDTQIMYRAGKAIRAELSHGLEAVAAE
jgi:4-hydroxy-2-oxoheptanedioate aldolase